MKKIRLIELFSGLGCQNLSMKYLGLDYEAWKTCEWSINSMQAYKDINYNDAEEIPCDMTKEELVDYLLEKGISNDHKNPLTMKQIKRMNINKLKTIWSNIQITRNLVNIQKVKGEDLEIVDKDNYDYVVFYSFPCQSISTIGKNEGMVEGSGSSSSLLWEVKRLLLECNDLNALPQILIMENVPTIHSSKHINEFNKWINILNTLGYSSVWYDLNAKDYGIPQSRNRCFMISALDPFRLPKKPNIIPLSLSMYDLLSNDTDASYQVSVALKRYFLSKGSGKYLLRRHQFISNIYKEDRKVANTLTCKNGTRHTDNYVPLSPLPPKEIINEYNLDIRSLTEEECFLLMSIRPSDMNKCKINQTKYQMFHLAGDGICVNVLMALLGELYNVEWEDEVRDVVLDCYNYFHEDRSKLEIKMLKDKINQLENNKNVVCVKLKSSKNKINKEIENFKYEKMPLFSLDDLDK